MITDKSGVPPYAEERRAYSETEQIQEILSEFKQPAPSNFFELKELKWMCSTEGWKNNPLCERYNCFINGKWSQVDIHYALLKELEPKNIPYSIHISPIVLNKGLDNYHAYNVEKKEEIFICKPFTINDLKENLAKLFNRINELEAKKNQNPKDKKAKEEDNEITTLQEKIKELNEKLTNNLSEKEKETNLLTKKAEASEEKLNKVNKELQDKEDKIKNLEKEREQEQLNNNNYRQNNQRELAQKNKEISELKKDSKEKDKKIDFLTKNEENLKEKLIKLNSKIAELETDKSTNEEKNQELEKNYSELKLFQENKQLIMDAINNCIIHLSRNLNFDSSDLSSSSEDLDTNWREEFEVGQGSNRKLVINGSNMGSFMKKHNRRSERAIKKAFKDADKHNRKKIQDCRELLSKLKE